MMRLRYVVRINPSKSEVGDLAKYEDVTFAPMEALADGLGGLDLSLSRPALELGEGSYSYFSEGDLLLAKVTPCFENGKKAVAIDLPNGFGFATSEVHVIRPDTRRIDTNYLRYLLSSGTFRAAGIASMTGAGGLKRISDVAIKDFRLPIADVSTQKAIAEFLDRETGHINNLIAKKEQQIALLSERARRLVTLLVTRGPSAETAVRATGLDWLPEVPSHWQLHRAAHLFKEVSEPGSEDLPILSVSIHHGISDRELDDDERDRKVLHIEDRTTYKRVRPGYLAYNMMRAWQGAVGVSTVDGMVSPAYVVAKAVSTLHSPYVQFLLRTPVYIEEMRRRSKGITDFRLRLYWDQFRQIKLVLPPFDEQKQIVLEAERIVRQSKLSLEALQRSVALLREHAADLVTAAVTGKIDVRQRRTAVVVKADRSRFRIIVGAEIIQRHQGNPKFGRVKFQKEMYLAEAHVGLTELQGAYLREAAGPLDRTLVEETERGMEASAFSRAILPDIRSKNGGVTYSPLSKAGQHRAELEALLGARAEALHRLVELLRDFDTRAVEAIATLYAVWNDAIIDGETPDDNAIVRAVLNDWHPEKREKYKDADLRHWLAWMKRNGLVPSGKGPRTISTRPSDMFA